MSPVGHGLSAVPPFINVMTATLLMRAVAQLRIG